jgi:uncharacterized repeat protein (TIGR03803 family)
MKLKTFVSLFVLTLIASLTPLHAQTFTVIHTFNGSGGDGANPFVGVTLRAGVLYGTTNQGGLGGANGPGTVYQLTRASSGWSYALIYQFPADQSGGSHPNARVAFGPDGHLYGTTQFGGAFQRGVVFTLTPPLSICKTLACFWKEKLIYQFQGAPDGDEPTGDLAWDPAGNIYGTTFVGGTGGDTTDGTVYELQPGNPWTEQVIHNFVRFGGIDPFSGVLYIGGKLYGTSSDGGLSHQGAVFELALNNGIWMENHLHDFGSPSQGFNSFGGMVIDAAGNFYGATEGGGSGTGGVVYELSFLNGVWEYQVLYNFAPFAGCGPQSSLTIGSDGNLYGTTVCQGASHLGSVFKLSKVGNGWLYTSVHDFTGGDDGAYPIGGVTIDTDGTLYGTASGGGSQNSGTVWMITP